MGVSSQREDRPARSRNGGRAQRNAPRGDRGVHDRGGAGQLCAETASGAEVPFELVDTAGGPRGRVPLYCYRPLTGPFIRERLGLLSALPTYAPAARALSGLDGVDAYLRQRGESRIPAEPRERADTALRSFLAVVFDERSEFAFDPDRFEAAYDELEQALYEGRAVTTVSRRCWGSRSTTRRPRSRSGEGLSLVRGERSTTRRPMRSGATQRSPTCSRC